MHVFSTYLFLFLLASSSLVECKSQQAFGGEHLLLTKTIRLPNVKGRIDHLDVNVKDQVIYLAALGNNTVEVIDLVHGTVVHSIKALNEPQGVGYIPQRQELFVANGGTGDCYFYDTKNFEKKGTIKLSSDADDVRYDSMQRRIYVGYGTGGIAIIDADTHQQIGNIQLPAHPEGFQLDNRQNTLYVNLPDDHSIGVADLKGLKLVNRWKNHNASANFPMAIDTVSHRIFVGYRHPSKLVMIDTNNGNEVSSSNIVGDTDDLYYDPQTKRIYVSGGDGTINIFAAEAHTLKQIANIPTRSGARTSLLIPALHLFVVGVRAESDKDAQLLVYKTN